MKKRLMAILLAVVMVISMMPVGVMAADSGEDKDPIVYVSLGDSMTNGYGLDGYDGESGVVNYAMRTYSNKFAAWLAGYTGEIEDDQVIFTGSKGTVDHRQLAMSGMRAEDLHWLLELDHTDAAFIHDVLEMDRGSGWNEETWYETLGFKTGDYRTFDDLADYNYRLADGAAKVLATYAHKSGNGYGYYTPSYGADKVDAAVAGLEADPYWPGAEGDLGDVFLQIGAEFYQESVKDADVITLALGNTNFGTYMLNEIMDIVMYGDESFAERYDIEKVFDLADLEPDMEARVRGLIDEYDYLIDEYFADLAGGDEAKMDALRNVIIYCGVSFAVNYIGSIDAILRLNENDHVDIIQMALMNAYASEEESINGITLGDMVDILYTPINAFIAALYNYMQLIENPLYEKASFYYAEADTVSCMVDVFGDDFYKKDGAYVKYNGLLNGEEGYTANEDSTVRDRFIENIVEGQVFDLMNSMGIGVDDSIGIQEIADYDMMTPTAKAVYAAANQTKAKSIALYLAFENATIQAGKGTVTMDSLAALGVDLGTVFGGIMSTLEADATAHGKDKYLDAAAAVVAAGSGGTLTADQVKALVQGGDAAIYTYIANNSGGMLTGEKVKALYEADDRDAAIYGFVAGLSDGYLAADEVKNLYTAVKAADGEEAKNAIIYASVANIASNPLLTAEVLKTLYEAPDQDAAIEAYIAGVVKSQMVSDSNVQGVMERTGHATVDEVLVCDNADHTDYCGTVQDTYAQQLIAAIANLQTAVGGVELLWTAVNGVDSLKGVIANIDSLKFAVDSATSLCYLLGLPETLSAAMVNDSTLSGILCMNARCLIGTGIGGHPSYEGHEAVYQALKWSYENGYTSEDETEDNINKAVDAAIKLIYENRHEIYAYAYSYAAEEGYIDIAIKELDTLRGYINAVDYASSGASAELKEKLAAVIEELNVDIDALIKFIKDAQTLEVFEGQILDLIGEFTNDMALFEALLKQAEIDSQKQLDALYKAIQKYITDTLNAVYDYVYDMIAEIYDELVDEIAALAAEYGPEAEAFVREWLYKNPQAVISALIEFGEDVDAFINYWTPYVKLILGPAWDAYGGDLMAALAELVELLKAEATELGGQALEALVKYIESLNLEAQIEAIAKALKDGSVEIGEKTFGELTGIVEELDGKLGGNVSAIVAALEELAASEDAAAAKAVIQETIESILAQEEELSAQILSIEGDILAAKAEIETAVTAIDSLYDIIKPLIIVLNNPDQFDLSDTADAVKAIIAELTTAAKAVQNAAEILVTLTGDINTAARKIDAALKAMYADLSTAAGKIETTLVEAGAAADALMVDTYTAIENLVTTTGGKVTTDAATLVAFCREKVTAAVNEFIAAAETVIYKATHGDLLVDAKTRYLAIGDEENVYTTELAALLGLEDYQIVSRLTADTDLVTVDFGRTDFSDFINAQAAGYVAEIVNGNEALAGLLSGSYGTAVKAALDSYGIDLDAELTELDWDKYLDAKAIGVKDETIKGIRITAVDHGLMETYTLDLGAMLQPVLDAETGVPGTVTIDCVIEIPVADLACALLDNVLYSYVSFAADYAVALDEIREVAPDAEVVVLGLVDADEDLVFSVGEAVIDLGDYTDILVNFVNAHYFAYALVNGEDVTYVAENTAEAIYNALNIRSIDWWTCDGGDNCACKVFTDLKCDAWYHNAICYNYNFGLMIGMSADKFEPSTTTSRAMIVTTLYRLEGSPAVTGENSYKDVKDGAWYTDAIIWATENGIVEGYGNGLFGPNNDVTREQIATMLYRYADYLGMDVSDTIALDAYTDADEIHGWALDAMKWANAVKLMEGRTETTINPRDNTMRSELATLLYRWDHGFAE